VSVSRSNTVKTMSMKFQSFTVVRFSLWFSPLGGEYKCLGGIYCFFVSNSVGSQELYSFHRDFPCWITGQVMRDSWTKWQRQVFSIQWSPLRVLIASNVPYTSIIRGRYDRLSSSRPTKRTESHPSPRIKQNQHFL
jgi:hypothetical protein